MRESLYIDDPELGLSPDTSHPTFVTLAPASFYEEGEEFTPFGNDDGNDTLRGLEDWYSANGGDADVAAFLTELLAEWDLGVPRGIADAPDAELIAWLGEDDMYEVYVTSEAKARVAAALGELKVTGKISPAVATEGRRGVRVQRVLTEDTSRYPDWEYRDEALGGLADIERVLTAATS